MKRRGLFGRDPVGCKLEASRPALPCEVAQIISNQGGQDSASVFRGAVSTLCLTLRWLGPLTFRMDRAKRRGSVKNDPAAARIFNHDLELNRTDGAWAARS